MSDALVRLVTRDNPLTIGEIANATRFQQVARIPFTCPTHQEALLVEPLGLKCPRYEFCGFLLDGIPEGVSDGSRVQRLLEYQTALANIPQPPYEE